MKLERIVYLAIGGVSLLSPINSGANEAAPRKVEVRKSYNPDQIKRIVEETALDHGLDPYFASAVAYHESGYRSRAVSYMGARGVMQLMPKTAKELGVDIDNPVENIRGGVRLLKQLENRYGGDEAINKEGIFRDVLAAYHAGFPTIDIMKRKYGEEGWFRKLTRGTRSYVKEVLGTYRDTIEVNALSIESMAYVQKDCDYVE